MGFSPERGPPVDIERPSRDFRITPSHGIGKGSLHEKARNNLAAIRTLKQIIPGKKGIMRRGVIQLQASDYLAYEIRKFVVDHPKYKSGERTPRKSLALLRATPADKPIWKDE